MFQLREFTAVRSGLEIYPVVRKAV
jgi:hypothetical protein